MVADPTETLEMMSVCNLYEPIAQRDATLSRAVIALQEKVERLSALLNDALADRD